MFKKLLKGIIAYGLAPCSKCGEKCQVYVCDWTKGIWTQMFVGPHNTCLGSGMWPRNGPVEVKQK